MNSSINTALFALFALSVLLMLACSHGFAEGWTVTSNPAQGYQVAHPDSWEVLLARQTNMIGKSGLDLLNADYFKSRQMEMRVYILNNPAGKRVTEFLTADKTNGTKFIERRQEPINGMDAVIVGYRYDPPAWGIIRYEVEMMIALDVDRIAYVQVSATTDVTETQLMEFLDKIRQSFNRTS